MCGALGEAERERSGKNKEDAEEPASRKDSSLSFLNAFPKARYEADVAMKIMPLSAIFVVMIVSNQLTLKYVEVSFYNVAR